MTKGETDGGRKPVLPYVAYKSFKNFVDGLRGHGLPGRIDRSVMGSLSGATQTNILHALRYLKLTADDGKPTEKLTNLVKAQGEEKQKYYNGIVKESYVFLFSENFDLKTATSRQLDERFEGLGISGDTIRKCVAFFISIAKDGDIQLSKYIQKIRRQRQPGGTRQKKTHGQQGNNGAKGGEQEFQHSGDEKPPEGMVRIPISIGIGKIWTLTMNQDYNVEDVDRFVQIVRITLGLGEKK